MSITDLGDPPFSEVLLWTRIKVKEKLEKSNSKYFWDNFESKYFTFKPFMNKFNHYLEGTDTGEIDITNLDLAILFMIKYKIGNPVHFKLSTSNEKS